MSDFERHVPQRKKGKKRLTHKQKLIEELYDFFNENCTNDILSIITINNLHKLEDIAFENKFNEIKKNNLKYQCLRAYYILQNHESKIKLIKYMINKKNEDIKEEFHWNPIEETWESKGLSFSGIPLYSPEQEDDHVLIGDVDISDSESDYDSDYDIVLQESENEYEPPQIPSKTIIIKPKPIKTLKKILNNFKNYEIYKKQKRTQKKTKLKKPIRSKSPDITTKPKVYGPHSSTPNKSSSPQKTRRKSKSKSPTRRRKSKSPTKRRKSKSPSRTKK